MNIVILSDLPHFVVGGAEMQACRLAESWLDAGHEVRVIGRRMQGVRVQIGCHQVPVHSIPTVNNMGRPLRGLSFGISLVWLLIRHARNADVVYARFLAEAAFCASILRRACWLRGVVVATPANTYGAGEANYLKRLPFHAHIIRTLDRGCDRINLIAPAMQAELKAAGFDGGNFSFIPNGIPIRPPTPKPRVQRTAFFAGRLTRQKGLDVLMHAVQVAGERIHDGAIRLAGDGPERDTLIALARKLGIAAKVIWLGQLSQLEISAEMDGASLFLLPSRYEGMSNAGLEAMERSLPILLTRCGGLDAYVDTSCGWVVPIEEVTPLAAALVDAFSIPADTLAHMGHAARALVEREFSMASVSARYLKLFEEASGGSS